MQDSPATLQTSASSSVAPPAATTLVAAGSTGSSGPTVVASTSSLAAAAAVAASSSASASSSSSSVSSAAANGHDAKQHNGFTSTGTAAGQVGSATTTTTNSSSGSVNNNNNNNNNVNVQSGGGGGGNNNNNNAANSNNVIVGPQSNNNRDGSTLNNSNNTSNNSPTTQVAANNLQLDKGNQEIIRLIGQYLQDIGLDKSVKTLFSESGCRLEHPAATKFREHVISGDWLKADADLKELEHLIEDCKPQKLLEMKFILLEQKYLEYLEDGCPLDALNVLRNELTPLQHKISRVHQLSSYMMCSNAHDLHQRAKWDGKGILSRTLVMERLQTFLPPSVMMPPRRLRGLLQQAVGLQTQHCLFHNMAWETNLQNVSLLTDHCCATDGFPMQTIQILNDHCDEVWICKFSPDGLKLATGSKDTTVIIWDVDPYKLTLKLRRILGGQSQMSVAFVSWSPDSKLLLVGGPDDSPEVYIWNVDDGKLVMKMLQSMEDSLSCGAFNRDGTRFVCGGIKGQFYLCDLNGTILESWEGVRINYVNFRSDNKTILASDSHFRIRGYNFDSPRSDFDILKEPHAIMTFTVNSNDRLALLNVSNQGLHLWDMKDRCLVRRFQGIRQNNFAIHSCFGGVNESFVASGSEDKLVCIWHIKREQPLAKLEGHTKTVNCVSWNPVYPQLLASASDDATVRIWGPKPHCGANATPESDDCSSSCSSSSSWNMTS